MKYLISVVLLSALTFHNVAAIPVKSTSSESSESSYSTSSNESTNESVYLIKEVSYEIGLVGTVDLGNSTKSVVVSPEDRIETEDIVLWTSSNGEVTENDVSANALSTEAVLTTTEAAPTESEINNDSVNPSKVQTTSLPPLSATEQFAKETTVMSNEVRK